VIVEAFSPKETLFELENVNAEASLDVVPAEILMLAALRLIDAVMTEPFKPNETLFEFENVIADKLFDVVPAETLMFVSEVAIEAVMVEALRPNETLFELENVNAEARFDVVPALRLIEACVEATVTDAVTTELFDIPNVTLFEFEKTTVPLVAV
jgi:hypothetical protein